MLARRSAGQEFRTGSPEDPTPGRDGPGRNEPEKARIEPSLLPRSKPTFAVASRGCRSRGALLAPPRNEADPTGAGDVFAAALFVRLHRGDTPEQAARFATRVAADFVTQPQLDGLP